ncbi:helix-turn-helix transcriptional regulator [Phenylobacterium aquaticum]|uniref:ArsR/SmtB family transcription factor n=1 Tax=Phenylobacterium aquaticum TaxID=1763816 RepID=UPI0026EC2FEB|nr:metalloregulator ArsR/SmtB family transcription factor [Phenylobacterium aquaticum]
MQSGATGPAILDALGDPIRRLIYQRLSRRPSNVTNLAKGVPVSRSAVSHHLRVLRDALLVDVEVEGRHRVYSLRREGLEPLQGWIAEIGAARAAASGGRT